jgi:ectoine hydroxylase-related dioxygenase (phytanoyl-CoA dioxygenase family)
VHSQLLIDEELAAEVHRVGYVVAGQVLDHRALQAVREVHQRFEPLISSRRPDRWYTSGAVEDAEVRGAIYSELGDLVREAVTPLAPEGVRVLGSHFHVNPAGSSDGIAPHQDVPLVDEAIASTLNGWIPLSDVSDANAPLCVVPGSHRFGWVDRSLQMSWRYDGLDQLFREFAVPIPVPAGHLILFDGALVHCSGPNRSASDRVAANFHFAPSGEHVYHVVPVEDDPEMVDAYMIRTEVFHHLGPASVGVTDASRHLGRRTIRPGSTDPARLRELCGLGAAL